MVLLHLKVQILTRGFLVTFDLSPGSSPRDRSVLSGSESASHLCSSCPRAISHGKRSWTKQGSHTSNQCPPAGYGLKDQDCKTVVDKWVLLTRIIIILERVGGGGEGGGSHDLRALEPD